MRDDPMTALRELTYRGRSNPDRIVAAYQHGEGSRAGGSWRPGMRRRPGRSRHDAGRRDRQPEVDGWQNISGASCAAATGCRHVRGAQP
jgi:hypothetical protein